MALNKQGEWVDWVNTKVLQKAVLIDEQEDILVLKRAEGRLGSRPGKWDLVGGSVEPDDLVQGSKPHLEAIRREIKQETGLEVQDIEPVFVDSWVFTKSPGQILGLAIGYKAKIAGTAPEVILSEEHSEFRWLPKDEILALDFGDDGDLHTSILKEI